MPEDPRLSTIRKNQSEQFVAKHRSLIIKEISAIGVLKGDYDMLLRIDSFRFTSVLDGSSDTAYGIRVAIDSPKHQGDGGISHLIDYDELDDLISGVSLVERKLSDSFKGVDNYTEVFYLTSEGFKVGFYVPASSVPEPTVFCLFNDSHVFVMPTGRLPQMRKLIQKGKESCLAWKSH